MNKTTNPPTEPIKKINCCDKCRAWSMKFKSDVYPCHNTDCECHVKVKSTVEKWEKIADLWRYARKPPTAGGAVDMKMPKQIFIERVIDLIVLSVQEAKAGIEFKALQDFMGFVRNGHNLKPGDLDRIEGEYALFMSRYYLEFTDEYLASLKQEEEK